MKQRTIWVSAALVIVLLVEAGVVAAELPAVEAPAMALPFEQENGKIDSGTETSITSVQKMSVDQCVQIALRNSPHILEKSYMMNASRSRVGQAWSDYYPKITLSSAYTNRNSFVTDYFKNVNPVRSGGYNNKAELTQNIFDFGRTGGSVLLRQKEMEASGENLRDTTSEITFNVKKAYYEFLKAGKSRDVYRESVMHFEKLLEQATSFYEAGVRSRFDVTTAQVELGNEKLKLIGAENAFRVARVTLNNVMGMPQLPEYTIEDDTLPFQKLAITFEEARDKAFLNRPDIGAAAATREAYEEALSLARKGHLPTLTANANYTRSGESYPPGQDAWQVDIVLTIPFFTGFETTHKAGEAKENLGMSKAREEALRQKVLLDLQTVYLKLVETEDQVGLTELTVQAAEENSQLAQGKYEAGIGSPIDVTDALVKLSRARQNYIAALADYKAVAAELRREMGE